MFDFCHLPNWLTVPTYDAYWRLPMLPIHKCYFITSKSRKYLKVVCFFLLYLITIKVLTSQNFEGISPYFVIYCALDEHTYLV